MKNKKILGSVIWLFLMAVLFFPVSANAMSIPSGLGSHSAFAVIDANSGRVLMRDKMNQRVYPASTTKLMTAMVLLERAEARNMSLNTKITVTDAMLLQVDKDLTSYGMKAGEVYTLKTLMHMILISSYGDATVCASVAVYGSVEKCVIAMNKKTAQLGLSKTHFDNPGGLDVGNNYRNIYTTAYEMACITREAMRIKTIRSIVAQASYMVREADGTEGRMIYSTNLFYSRVPYPASLYTIIGSKTGTTRAAGYVFSATAADSSGHEVICTYMGKTSAEATFMDIQKILTAVFQAQKSGQIVLGEKNAAIPIIRQNNLITAKDFVKEASTKEQAFRLRASALGGAALAYTSSIPDAVSVNKNGKVFVAAKFSGQADITIRAKGTEIYKKAVKTVSITVRPMETKLRNTCTETEGKLNLFWRKRACCGGYQIQYTTDPSFKTGTRKKTVPGKRHNSAVVESVSEGQVYYARIRTYTKTNGKPTYSAWSKKRKIA